MNLKKIITLLVLSFSLLCSTSYSNELTTVKLGEVVALHYGRFTLQENACIVNIEVNGMGGSLDLTVEKTNKKILGPVIDAPAFGWISENDLIFSVSSVYGKPGLFKFSCREEKLQKLVAAKTIIETYSDGADFFWLQRLDPKKLLIYYYYHPDPDAVPPKQDLRNDKNLYVIDNDGKNFAKVK